MCGNFEDVNSQDFSQNLCLSENLFPHTSSEQPSVNKTSFCLENLSLDTCEIYPEKFIKDNNTLSYNENPENFLGGEEACCGSTAPNFFINFDKLVSPDSKTFENLHLNNSEIFDESRGEEPLRKSLLCK